MASRRQSISATPMDDNIINFNEAKAKRIFEQAYEMQTNGFLDAAIALYSQSIEWYPTAKAYTFMGWAYAAKREYELAIEFCRCAIEIDPDYGNPYNDIGAYLIELGRPDESIEYLKKAIESEDYDCRFYPYYNLGKVYIDKNQIKKAIECFQQALDLKPEFYAARDELDRLTNRLN